jgi:RNA polymerase sigma factor (sigma-70 family)
MLENLIARLRTTAARGEAGALPDGELLRRWTHQRDEAAFELLVLRHGRLVLGVCQRLLGNAADVEDAFQATFLILVRKGQGISRGQALAAWLHTVAHRVALEARTRRGREGADLPANVAAPDEPDGADSREVREALDEEVRRLPEKYRLPFVLCHLEGWTNEEAARELGRPVGTILSRLSRARQQLRERLARRGLAPSAVLVPPALSTLVPAQLVRQTVHAALAVAGRGLVADAVSAPALALMEGALRAMLSAKLKAACVLVLSLAVLAVGGGAVGYRVLRAQTPPAEEVKQRQGKEAAELRTRLREAQERTARIQEALDTLDDGAEERTRPVDEDAKERAEVLAVRVRIKKAELGVAKAILKASSMRLEVMENTARTVPRSISQEDLSAGRLDVVKAQGQVEVKEAELQESELLLAQAKRRIASPAESPKPGVRGAAPPRTLEQRVQDLEKQVERLTRQIERRPAGRGDGK